MPSRIPAAIEAGLMWDNIGPIAAVAGFFFQFIVMVGTGIWKLSQVKSDLLQAIDASGKEIDERIDSQGREFGETVTALRIKINDVELYVRDTFIRRDSFFKVQEGLQGEIRALSDKMEARLERMEGKIDRSADH